MKHPLLLATLAATTLLAADPPEPKFEAVTIDAKIQIGYGVAVADVDGDKLPDILLADKKQFVWYRNPGAEKASAPGAWAKHLIAENLTKNDNVCLAAQDIDGDGKCELAVGAEWSPGDTENSGAVFYLIAPADRTQPWTPVKLHAEPTTHRMRWMELGKEEVRRKKEEGGAAPASSLILHPSSFGLVVVPLHGRGNKNGEGAGVKVLLYHPPTPLNDPQGEWKTELVNESMHMTHNFAIRRPSKLAVPQLLLGGREGISLLLRVNGESGGWQEGHHKISTVAAGEVRPSASSDKLNFVAVIEPMHGNVLSAYVQFKHEGEVPEGDVDGTDYAPHRLSDKLTEGHALGCGDLLGAGSDQIVVGWRGTPGKEGSTHGVAVWTPLDPQGAKWRESMVDAGGMACEDLQLADLDGNGKLDIVASGRATKNVKVYFNRTGG